MKKTRYQMRKEKIESIKDYHSKIKDSNLVEVKELFERYKSDIEYLLKELEQIEERIDYMTTFGFFF